MTMVSKKLHVLCFSPFHSHELCSTRTRPFRLIQLLVVVWLLALTSPCVSAFVSLPPKTTINKLDHHQQQQQRQQQHDISRQTQLKRAFRRSLTYLNNNESQNSDRDASSPSPTTPRLLSDMDPHSREAEEILRTNLGLSERQHQQLADYAALIVEWNERINLVSRKDCTLEVVFGRHVLPCLAPVALHKDENDTAIAPGSRVVDVGTGGGLPGVPLAIAFPESEFLLMDSVGKKIKAVDDMVERLGLTNVKTKHARAEEVLEMGNFDVCVGRSVASLSKFCGWMSHLMKPDTGKLMYIIGGEVPESCLAEKDEPIHDLLRGEETGNNTLLLSDKRLLIFPQKAVVQMAKNAGGGVKLRQNQSQHKKSGRKKNRSSGSQRNKKARGAWDKRDDNAPKQRGYENFQRYESR